MIWFGVMNPGPHPFAFIYDLRIDDEFQQKGYGKQAMAALEEKVKELGLDTISLTVFGHNQAARALYEKMGYQITHISMSKKLTL